VQATAARTGLHGGGSSPGAIEAAPGRPVRVRPSRSVWQGARQGGAAASVARASAGGGGERKTRKRLGLGHRQTPGDAGVGAGGHIRGGRARAQTGGQVGGFLRPWARQGRVGIEGVIPGSYSKSLTSTLKDSVRHLGFSGRQPRMIRAGLERARDGSAVCWPPKRQKGRASWRDGRGSGDGSPGGRSDGPRAPAQEGGGVTRPSSVRFDLGRTTWPGHVRAAVDGGCDGSSKIDEARRRAG